MLDLALRPARQTEYTVLDLFSGCGGLSLGFEAAGFGSRGIDCNESCVQTYNANLSGRCSKLVINGRMKFPGADVVIGGPPCQPFSVRGMQGGNMDRRNGIPAFVSAIRKTCPRVWVLENVQGVLYKNHAYFKGTMNRLSRLGYDVSVSVINCVDYGVPQNRIRVIAMGTKEKGVHREPTRAARRVTAGEAIGDLASKMPKNPKFLTSNMDRYVAAYERASKCARPRDLHMDRPARTLTCRNLAGATSDMQRIRLKDKRRRRLTVREAARLQSFPDWFEFYGSELEAFYQIGNAVPPLFALALARQVKNILAGDPCLFPKPLTARSSHANQSVAWPVGPADAHGSRRRRRRGVTQGPLCRGAA